MRTLNLRFACLLVAILIAFIAGLFGVHQFQYRRIANDILWQARHAREEGMPEDAAQFAYQYLAFYPDDCEVLIELAGWLEERASGRKRLVHVSSLLNRVLQLQPDRSDVRRRVVDLNIRIGRWGECLDQLERLLVETPNDAELHAHLGVCQESIGKTAEAAESLARAWQLNPARAATAIDYAGLLMRRMNRPDDAKKVLDEAVRHSPNSAEIHVGLAQYYRTVNKPKEAENEINVAIQLSPKDLTTLTTAADIAQAAGKTAKAREIMQQSAAIAPNNGRVACSLAWLLLHEGKSDQAIEGLRGVLQENAGDADVLTMLGDILALDGRLEQLEQVVGELDKLRRAAPERGWNADYLQARLHMRRGEWPQALQVLDGLRLTAGRNAALSRQANYLISQCHFELHDWPQALDAYRRVLEADAHAGYFRLEYARLLARSGQYANAIKEFRAAVQRPDLPPRAVIEILTDLVDRCQRFGGDAAIKELDRLFETVRADDVSVYSALAKVELLRLRHRTADGLKFVGQCLERHGNSSAFIAARVRLLEDVYGPERAATTLSEAERRLGQLPDFRIARLKLGGLRMPAGRSADLFKLCDGVEATNPEDRTAVLTELVAALTANDDPQRVAAFDRLRASRPDHVAARTMALSRANYAGEESEVQKILSELAGIEGPNGPARQLFDAERLVARTMRDANAAGAAQEALDRVAKQRKGHPLVEFLRGRLAELTDQHAAALTHYTAALDAGLLDHPVEEHFLALGRMSAADGKCQVLVEQSPLFDRLRLENDRSIIRALLPLAAASTRPILAERLVRRNPQATPGQLVWLGKQFQPLGLNRFADLVFTQATNWAPLCDEAWGARLAYHAAQQDTARIQELIVDAKKRLPAGEANIVLSRGLEIAGLPAEQSKAIQLAVGLNSNGNKSARQTALQFQQSGRWQEARQRLQQMIDDPAITAEDAAWARRALAINLTIAPSLQAYQSALKLLDANRTGGQFSPDDEFALAMVHAAQRSRIVTTDGKSGRQEAIRLLSDSGTANSPEALVLLARLLRAEGDSNALQRLRQRLAAEYADSFAAAEFLARDALQQGDMATAQRWLPKLDAKRPETLALFFAQAAMAGNSGAAIGLLERDIASAPAGATRYARLVRAGHIAVETIDSFPLGDRDAVVKSIREAAIRWYRAGLGKDPQALLQLVRLYCEQRQLEQAFDLLQLPEIKSAFGVETLAAAVVSTLRYGQFSASQSKTVERQVAELIRQNPGSVALWLVQADLYELTKRADAAATQYLRVLERDPTNAMALNNLGWTRANEVGKMGDALKLIQAAIDHHGPLDELLDSRARLLFAAGQPKEALRDMIDAAAAAPNAKRLYHLAVMYRECGQTAQADEALRLARRFGPVPDGWPSGNANQVLLSRN